MTTDTAKRQFSFPSTQAFNLTDAQRHTITHSLYVAAERFTVDAATARDCGACYSPLVEQFERQAAETREIAERIENAEYVKLGREVAE